MTECRLPMPLRTPRIVREYAVRLCAQLGRRLDDACPIADASSEDGIRVHATGRAGRGGDDSFSGSAVARIDRIA